MIENARPDNAAPLVIIL